MAIISVMYPSKPGSKFDMGYYLNTHMKMVEATWGGEGLRGYSVLTGARDAAYQVIANLDFTSAAAFQAAVAKSGAKVMGDVPNFTDLQPVLQVSEVESTFVGNG